jgi:signal peptidase
MSVSSSLRAGSELLLLVGVAALVVGSVAGQPVLFGFVETGSMEPTLSPNDGFVSVPGAVAGDVDVGDVVVFRAERLQGGGLTTHRVVGETGAGYVTQGDANPTTDQAADEPPVKDAQIVAKALQIGGRVVVLPHLGTVVSTVHDAVAGIRSIPADVPGGGRLSGVQWVASLLLVVTIAIYLLDWRGERGGVRADRRRDTRGETGRDARVIIGVLTLFVVIVTTASMVVPGGPQAYGFVSSNHDVPGASVIGVGEMETTTYFVTNGGLLPVMSVLETEDDGITVEPTEVRVGPRSTAEATVTLSAPAEPGYYRRFVVEHRYLVLLPSSWIRALYGVHPWLPIVAVDSLVGIPFYLLGTKLVGTGRIRTYSRDGPSAAHRVFNKLR